jgi:transposase
MNGYLGIDVSKDGLDVMLVREQRHEAQHFTNSELGFAKLHSWVKRRVDPRAVHACLEATGPYSEAIAAFLHAQEYRVSVVNPARIKGYAESQLRRNKTDRLDAALIADFCRTQQPAAWTPPRPEVRHLQALVRHLDDLTHMRLQVNNRLKPPMPLEPVQHHLQDQLALLDQPIAQTKQAIREWLNQHPDLKRQKDLLTSIPGIGDLTAGKLLAECRDLRAFQDVRQRVAFAGLNPRHHTSGSSIRKKPTLSRTGSAALRAALYMPALAAMRFKALLRAFADRLRSRGVPGKAIVAAVMRKLLHLAFGVVKSGQPFDPNWRTAS